MADQYFRWFEVISERSEAEEPLWDLVMATVDFGSFDYAVELNGDRARQVFHLHLDSPRQAEFVTNMLGEDLFVAPIRFCSETVVNERLIRRETGRKPNPPPANAVNRRRMREMLRRQEEENGFGPEPRRRRLEFEEAPAFIPAPAPLLPIVPIPAPALLPAVPPAPALLPAVPPVPALLPAVPPAPQPLIPEGSIMLPKPPPTNGYARIQRVRVLDAAGQPIALQAGQLAVLDTAFDLLFNLQNANGQLSFQFFEDARNARELPS